LLAHQLAEDGAGGGAVAVVDDDNVGSVEGLFREVCASLVSCDVDAAGVDGDERVGEVPAGDAGVVVVIVRPWRVLIGPGGKGLVVLVGVSVVVEVRGLDV